MKILVENLTKIYKDRKVLNIESLEIQNGSFCGIMGSNGAGKSTLLNLIGGMDIPSSGKIFYGEKKLASPPLKEITMVFQRPYMLATTVEKNIAYPLKLRNETPEKIEKRVAFLMEELGIIHLRKQKAIKLSGGETQKVALARALSFEPKLLLLDEPTANIDPTATAEIETILKKINETQKTTIILITHNLAQGKRLCNDLVFLSNGELIDESSAHNIF